jgi:hypothetical protein
LTSPYQIFRELHQPDLFWPEEPDKTLLEMTEHAKKKVQEKIEILLQKITEQDVIPNAERYGMLR